MLDLGNERYLTNGSVNKYEKMAADPSSTPLNQAAEDMLWCFAGNCQIYCASLIHRLL